MPETLNLPSQPPRRPTGVPKDDNSATLSETGPGGEFFSSQGLDQGWSLGSDAFNYICSLAADRTYQSLIEFGSGRSTTGWVSAIPGLVVTSFEHDRKFCEDTKRQVVERDLADQVKVHYAPLRTVWIDGRPFQSYAPPRALPQADIIVIDGPPAHTRRGRETCLYYAYDHLRVGGTVVLDDASRPDEQQSVANWMAVYPGSFEVEWISVGHGLAVLYKTAHVPRKRMVQAVLWDSYSVLAEKLVFGLKRSVALRLLARSASETESANK